MKSKELGKGDPCPKCARPMKRLGHKPEWRLPHGQHYYFVYWDYCQPCRHVQHYEAAKRWRAA